MSSVAEIVETPNVVPSTNSVARLRTRPHSHSRIPNICCLLSVVC